VKSDLSVADSEFPMAIGCIAVGKLERLLAADVALDFLPPRWWWILYKALDLLTQRN